MDAAKVKKTFEEVNALLTGHFALSSGNHSNQYLQCALVTQYPGLAAELADGLAKAFAATPVDVVLGPALGGVVIAQEVAQALHRAGNKKVRAIFCERVEGKFALRRGFQIQPGEKVLAVEDVVTTGGSVKEAAALARQHGGEVIGIATFIDRSVGPVELGAPLTSLLKIKADIYPAAQCPLCQQGNPVTKPGSRGLK